MSLYASNTNAAVSYEKTKQKRGIMSFRLKNIFGSFGEVDMHERLKVILLSLSFLLVIGGYTLVKELKDSVFLVVVGSKYLPYAKMFSVLFLIPAVVLYSKLVDILRRSDLLCLFAFLYSVGGLVCVYFLGHPEIGLENAVAGPDRLFGWIFYFFLEGYVPFVVSVLWAFVNSVTAPEEIKSNYVIMTASAKVGGALMAAFAWWLCLNAGCAHICSDVALYQVLLVLASLVLLVLPIIITYMMKHVPTTYLHGYEAAYQAEKKIEEQELRSKKTRAGGIAGSFKSFLSVLYEMFEGAWLLLRYPYVLGIFGMIFFWEIINVIFNFERLCVGHSGTAGLAGFGAFLYEQAFYTQLTGLIFVLFGTRMIVAHLGERKSLIAVPILIGTIIGFYLAFQSVAAMTTAYVLMRAVNYAFAYPLRESLYVPTTKAVKFKSKSWIDGFGQKLSKMAGSWYNVLMPAAALSTSVVFFGIIILAWVVMANALGRRFEKAVTHNEVIGSEG